MFQVSTITSTYIYMLWRYYVSTIQEDYEIVLILWKNYQAAENNPDYNITMSNHEINYYSNAPFSIISQNKVVRIKQCVECIPEKHLKVVGNIVWIQLNYGQKWGWNHTI